MPAVASPITVASPVAGATPGVAAVAGDASKAQDASGFGGALAALLAALTAGTAGAAGDGKSGKGKTDPADPTATTPDANTLAMNLLAALQAAPNAAAQASAPPLSTQTQSDLKDIIAQALDAGASGSGGQQRLQALLARLGKLEAAETGAGSTAAAQAGTEPQAFGQARSLLNDLLGKLPAGQSAAAIEALASNPPATTPSAAPFAPPNPAAQTSDPTVTAAVAAIDAAPTVSGSDAPPPTHPDPAASAEAAGPPAPLPVPPTSNAPSAPPRATPPVAKPPASPPGLARAGAVSNAPQLPNPQDEASETATPSVSGAPAKDAPQTEPRAAAGLQTAEAALASTPAHDHVDALPAQGAPVAPVSAQIAAQPSPPMTADPTRGSLEAVAYLSSQIVKQLGARSTEFQIQLHPADLGRVDVQIQIQQDGRLNAQLAFDNPAAAADFRGRADELRRSLEQAGFQLSDNSLSFGGQHAGGAGQGAGQNAGQNSGQAQSGQTAWGGARLRAFDGAETVAQAADAPGPIVRRSAGGLDMRV